MRLWREVGSTSTVGVVTGYVITALAMAVAVGAVFLIGRMVTIPNAGVIYLLLVVAATLWLGTGPALLGVALSLIGIVAQYGPTDADPRAFVIRVVVIASAHVVGVVLARSVRRKQEALQARNEDLQQQKEEIQAQSEELQSQGEEIHSQNEELRSANEDLERAMQIAEEAVLERDEFLSVAAHELKTPVTSLRGFAQTLLRHHDKRGAIDPERLRRALQVIDQQSSKLAKLIAQLLDLSRLEGGRLTLERQHVDLVRLVEEVVAGARLNTTRHTLLVEMPERAELFADAVRIEQVITNLVDNAIRYSPAGGPIEIKVATSDATVAIAVRDYGIGIPAEHCPHVFDRFYRAHEGASIAGLGLGLYISKEIVTLHGGQIDVECPLDGGSRFMVSLPLGNGFSRGNS